VNIEVYTLLASLTGVAVGGGITYFLQRHALRSAERADAKRQEYARVEARRTERVTVIDRLLASMQDAERAAAERDHVNTATAEWWTRAATAMDHVWVAEKMVRILCGPAMHDAAHRFANVLNDSIYGEPIESELWERLAPSRSALLDAARAELEGLDPYPS